MDVDSSQGRMAAYMRDHQDKVDSRWPGYWAEISS